MLAHARSNLSSVLQICTTPGRWGRINKIWGLLTLDSFNIHIWGLSLSALNSKSRLVMCGSVKVI